MALSSGALNVLSLIPRRSAAAIASDACTFPSGVSGLVRIAKSVAFGASSRSMASRFGARSAEMMVMPVALPPGRARLDTMPSFTGSPPITKTIGIDDVTLLAASADVEPPAATRTATGSRTSSAASAEMTSGPAVCNPEVPAINKASLSQATHEGFDQLRRFLGGAQESYHRRAGTLRRRGRGPCHYTGEKRNDFPPPCMSGKE